jgi:hypothetical protein
MSGSDEVNIMAANLLELDHHVGQVFILNFLPSSLMGNGPVLTEDTSEITVGEEDRARPIIAHYGSLFAKMRVRTENDGLMWSPTEAFFALPPIHPTLSGTELAMLEDGVGLLDSLSKFTLPL